MYQFSVYDFSDREIDQIVSLVRQSVKGSLPVMRAGLSKQVIDYALSWKLLEQRGKRLFFPRSSSFQPLYDLPVEALWRLVSPMLQSDGPTGYSLVNHKGWFDLNIYSQQHRCASDRDLEEKTTILLKLASHHYLTVQMAGSLWSIYREK